MRRYLLIAGWVLWTPAAVGVMARYVVDGYRGDASHLLWIGLGLIAASWLWGKVADRLKKPSPPPRKFTVYDWTEEADGVRFHARYEDGEEHEFFMGDGTTGTKGAV
jgi:hypothetical protein